jgi:hypothetical protein
MGLADKVTVQLNLNLDQVNLIITGLAKLPYEHVAELVANVRHSALQAVSAAEELAKAEEQQTNG